MCVNVNRQRVAELEQRLEKTSEENEHLSEQLERRDIQVFLRFRVCWFFGLFGGKFLNYCV